MTTVLADRAVFGVIIPSTNTAVEDEYYRFRAPGVSFHAGRILIRNAVLDSDETMEAFLEDLRGEIGNAVTSVLTCEPDALIMGMSAETFWGGVEGNARFEAWIREMSGLDVYTGASATHRALQAFGARRIGVITPYQPVADEQVRAYFTELGYDVHAVHGLKCGSATSIADVTPEEIRAAFAKVDAPDVDVLVQAGTNLPVIGVAAALEEEIGKPVVPINAATLWHAYRSHGITDPVPGAGRLLATL
ncbi:aspartate/glutamate racemase family protein [Actinocorallia sp. A-T 12471]|uniref:maleate cis-trans isomerase family protein n=1 Tax=Actinocorallia sp. A-T 12471 TaxID=3089813 RepID=UPI0029D1A282|nr:aspartate/glutamate racemase family protein [Actinocorallia sp. A-T 12471]MDX6744065.1 aspartate/glutamate racemase family protein [Actinocorallia sp. A-T 12471]